MCKSFRRYFVSGFDNFKLVWGLDAITCITLAFYYLYCTELGGRCWMFQYFPSMFVCYDVSTFDISQFEWCRLPVFSCSGRFLDKIQVGEF